MEEDPSLTDPTSELIRLKRSQISSLKKLLVSTQLELESLIEEQLQSKPRNVDPLPNIDKLSNEAISRYSRQMLLPELRPEGQKKLLSSLVLIVGCGGEDWNNIVMGE